MSATLMTPLAPILLAVHVGPPIGSWSTLDVDTHAARDGVGEVTAWNERLVSPATPATPPPASAPTGAAEPSSAGQPATQDTYTPPVSTTPSTQPSAQPVATTAETYPNAAVSPEAPPPSAAYAPPPNDTLVAAARRKRRGGGERATLFGDGGEGFGLHFDVSLKTTAVDNRAGLMMGTTIAPIIADRLQLGLTWHWLVTPQFTNLGPRRFNLEYNYGGFQMGVFVVRRGFFRLMVGGVVGGGSACIDDERLNECYSKASLFAGEPEVTAIFSLLKFMRISIGGGYRFVVPQRWSGPSGQELGGPTGTIALQLGAFEQLGKNAKKIRW
jgi:hypothetical protein